MKALGKILFAIMIFFPFSAYAVEGTCSWHGGVNCSVGADWDGSAVCNDGWRDSSESYYSTVECKNTHGTPCTSQEYETLKQKYNIDAQDRTIKDLSSQLYSLDAMNTKNSSQIITLSSQVQSLQSKLSSDMDSAWAECQALGAVEYQKMLSDLRNQYNQTPAPVPTSNPVPITSRETVKLDTGPSMTNDERCLKLNLGTWYNTDTQNCDSCPIGKEKDPSSNSCRVPLPTVVNKPLVPVLVPKPPVTSSKPKTTETIKSVEVKSTTTDTTTNIQEASTTIEVTPPVVEEAPIQPPQPPPPAPKTFWSKVISWIKFW